MLTQVLANLGKQGMAGQDIIKVGEALTATIPASTVSPQEQQDEDRKWAQRLNHAHGKLRQWQQHLEERREAQRQANRQVDSAAAHIAYWQSTLQAATRKDSNWESREKFEDVDYDYDSQAGDTEEDADIPGDEDSTSAGNSDMQLTMETAPTAPEQSTIFPPTASSPFQHPMGSAFTTGCDGPVPTNDALAAAIAHKHFVMTEGAKHGIPEPILDTAANEGHSMQLIISSYHQAKMAGELYILKKQHTDLSHSPLAQRMAEHLVTTYPDTHTTEPTDAKDEASIMHDFAATAGC